ncbi:MAG: DUF6529 family protein [Anaerolineae bacterium]
MPITMIKSILTTIALALALVQGMEMAQLKGYLRLFPIEKRKLRSLHRAGGVAALFLLALIAVLCIVSQGFYFSSLRVRLHALLGAMVILVLVVKVLITNRFRQYLRYNNALGAFAGLLMLGTFLLSALWYFIKGY